MQLWQLHEPADVQHELTGVKTHALGYGPEYAESVDGEELDDELTDYVLPKIEPVNETEMVMKAEPTPCQVSQIKTDESDDEDSYQPSNSSNQRMVNELEQGLASDIKNKDDDDVVVETTVHSEGDEDDVDLEAIMQIPTPN